MLLKLRRYRHIRALVRIHDLVMAAVTFPIAMYLRIGSDAFADMQLLGMMVAVFVPICAVVFPLSGINRGSWRYASLDDLIAILRAAAISIVATVLILFVVNRLGGMPRSVPVIAWLTLTALLGGPRVFYRIMRAGSAGQLIGRTPAGNGIPVLLYGYGDEADLYIRSLQHNRRAPYHVVGIVDRREKHRGRVLHGVPVIGTLKDIPRFLESMLGSKNMPVGIVITRQRMSRQYIATIVEKALQNGLTVYRLADLDVQAETGSKGPVPKPVDIEDILGRPVNALDLKDVAVLLQNRTVLITGAGGSIGSELARQIAACRPGRVVLFENSEFNLYQIETDLRDRFPHVDVRAVIGDVRDAERVREIMSEEKVETVFHAAALKHLPLVEQNPIQGIRTNVFGTRNVADAALEHACLAFVLVSTDKAVNPANVMGATKRAAETYCQALDMTSDTTRFMTVRFGNVLGSTGSVVPRFQQQIARGGPITVTDPTMTRYFMTITEAVHLILQAASQGLTQREDRGKIFVLEMGKPVRIKDLAEQMARLAGLTPGKDIEIV
ncbi:MAG: polysaccharide biosynthesis protein, partial [Rhodobiaceae bacterium]|nr:polysaccharide biosynthesis protein [Rhodobiaceae bacterium]